MASGKKTSGVVKGRRKLGAGERQSIAEALLEGRTPQAIVAELVAQGVDETTAKQEVSSAARSPYLAAGMRMVNRSAKRTWHLDVLAKLWRMRPESKGVITAEVDKLTANAFFSNFYVMNRPILIKGLVSHWPAMTRWNLDYFEDTLGDVVIEVQTGRNANTQFEIDKAAHAKTMAFREFVALLRQNEETNDYYATATNSGQNKQSLAPLWNDIHPIEGYLTDAPNEGFVWLGPKGTLTPFHHDLTNNLLLQVVGRKQVVMAPGFEVSRMRNSLHCFSDWSIDPNAAVCAPDGQRPLLTQCVIEPGDALFLPINVVFKLKSGRRSVTSMLEEGVAVSKYSSSEQKEPASHTSRKCNSKKLNPRPFVVSNKTGGSKYKELLDAA